MAGRFSLTGRTAFITGAGRGIGRAIAIAYADAGADLILCSRTLQDVQATAEQARYKGVKAEALRCDVSDVGQAQSVLGRLALNDNRVDILVNNAGTVIRKPAADITEADWDGCFNTNLKGLFFLTQTIGKHMISHGAGGRIVNISSVSGMIGGEERLVYAASKAGLNLVTKVLATEWGPYNITVNAIAPTFVRTSLTESLFAGEALSVPLQRTPLQRFPSVEDIAAAALYLASDAARNVSGQIITIDGGRTAT